MSSTAAASPRRPPATTRTTTSTEHPAPVRRRLIVSGHVQGVFFRDSIRTRADSLGVAGWVANRADGTVEAVLEGEPAAVAELAAFAHQGPERARVDDVRENEEQPEGLEGFRVR